MLLDEPTTGLDPDGISAVFRYLQERSRKGAAALISTHETSRFSSQCSRVIAMSAGKILADMPVEEFLSTPGKRTDDLWEAYLSLQGAQE